jgi:hypothetical protein
MWPIPLPKTYNFYNLRKVAKQICAVFVIYKKMLLEDNNHQRDENSPNPVTLFVSLPLPPPFIISFLRRYQFPEKSRPSGHRY